MANKKAISKANLELALSENNKKIKEFVRNENLLINSYFLDPVNSSGQTEWTSIGVTVDAWAMENTRGSVSLTDEGLAVKFIGDDYFAFFHKIVNWEHLLDKTVTLSAKVNGTVYSKAFTITLTDDAIDSIELSIPDGYMDFYKQSNQDAIQVRYIMETTPETVVTFEWVKLELGSVATAFFPPNKEVEKLKCEKANAYTLNGSTIDDITGWVNNKLQYIQTTSYTVVETAGWYRIAEYNSTTESVLRGSYGNACFLSLKRAYNHYGTEEYRIRLSSAYDSQTFKCEDATIGSKQLISKVRYTYDSEKAYIEIYYNEDLENPVFAEISNSTDAYTCWKAINFEATEETVDGVTVTTTYDIPASASPATSVDLANYLLLNGSCTTNYDKVSDLNNFYSGIGLFTSATSNMPDNFTYALVIAGSAGTGTVMQVAFDLLHNKGAVSRYCGSNVWQEWEGFKTDNYLPLSGGGTVQKASALPMGIKNTVSDACYLNFIGISGSLGSLGFNGVNIPVWVDRETSSAKALLHTGNSAKVVINASAPSDTSSLWVDTTNKCIKIYIDGAWQQVS